MAQIVLPPVNPPPPAPTPTSTVHYDASDNTWLPVDPTDPMVSQLAHTTCSVNLDAGCDFHTAMKYKIYADAWAHPAPSRCRCRTTDPEPAIYADRLGVMMSVDC